jgi:hypothetical protein
MHVSQQQPRQSSNDLKPQSAVEIYLQASVLPIGSAITARGSLDLKQEVQIQTDLPVVQDEGIQRSPGYRVYRLVS